jgi:hypothetical protein
MSQLQQLQLVATSFLQGAAERLATSRIEQAVRVSLPALGLTSSKQG